MKKIFTLIAGALVALSANAQKWNFSDWDVAEYTAETTVNGLTINATSSKKISIDENEKTIEGVKYTKRLKFGGKGSATERSVSFTVDNPGELKVIPASASSSTDRELAIALNGEKVATVVAKGKPDAVETVKISAKGTIALYSDEAGACNIYYIEFIADTGTEIWDASEMDLTNLPNATTTENTGDYWKKVPTPYDKEPKTGEGDDATLDEARIIADATGSLTFTDYTFTVKTTSVTLKGVATPNSPNANGEQDAPWQWVTNRENQFLNTDDGPVKFKGSPIRAKGCNPALTAVEYFYLNNDGATVGPRYIETYWTKGCGQLPKKGAYFEVAFEKAGTFVAGIFLSRAYRPTYVVEKESLELLPQSALTLKGYNNNNTVVLEGAEKAYIDYKFNDDYTVSPADPNLTLQDKEVFGHLSFNVEANKSYLLFMPASQLGLYGFQFTEDDPTNVEAITTKTQKNNAKATLYNLAGQKVDKSYKGIVIQNGRKFVNK